MKKEICSISLSKDWYDNYFTFYSDGTVIQICDKHSTKANIETEHKANELLPEIKKKLLENCPVEKIEFIINFMSTNQNLHK